MIKDKYKGGFYVNGKHSIETVEWLLSDESTNEALYFQAYDSNLSPLPDISTWEGQKWIDKSINKAKLVVSEDDVEVWLDDIRIK